jgi:hypothetical protein
LKFEKTWLKDTQVIELKMKNNDIYTPAPRRGRGVYCFTSVRLSFCPSKIFFGAFFSVTVDGRNLIFIQKNMLTEKTR